MCYKVVFAWHLIKGSSVLAESSTDNCLAALPWPGSTEPVLRAPQSLSTRVKSSRGCQASSVPHSHQAETDGLAKVTTGLISPRAAAVLPQRNSGSPGDLCLGTVSHAHPENCRDNEGLLPKHSGGEDGHEPRLHTHSGSPPRDLQPPRGPTWEVTR